ncbi:MAG: hypothetical protein HY913_05240 [Desulfomonile tiedjei]|nr:hypothetical protein [Desulfomonile tiedjei]
MIDASPSTQLDELKNLFFPYVLIGPLLSAFFAQQIDNVFVACLLFVLLVGSAFFWFKKRIDLLEKSILEQEKRLAELTGGSKEEPYGDGADYQ